MFIEVCVYNRNDPGCDLLTYQQKSDALAAFTPIEITEIHEDLRRHPEGAPGACISTFVVVTLSFIAGQLSAGFFGEIGKDVWQAAKRGLARLLHQRNDMQYSTDGRVYIIVTRADGKSVVVQGGVVYTGERGKLSDSVIEDRLGSTLDAYWERQPEVDRLLENEGRNRGPVLNLVMINGQPIVISSHHSVESSIFFHEKIKEEALYMHTSPLFLGQPPTITSVNGATAIAGSAFSFEVTATGRLEIAEPIILPEGVIFDPFRRRFTGTPKIGTYGTYPVTIIASNSAGVITQRFVLTVMLE